MDESPFMNFGNVERGQVITALYNNLFRAPLFRHVPKDSDFLVIRFKYILYTYILEGIDNLNIHTHIYSLFVHLYLISLLLLYYYFLRNTFKNKSRYYIREIKNIFVVGQTFPMQEVPSPPSEKQNLQLQLEY